MARSISRLFVHKRRAVAALLALFLSATYLWQGFHYHEGVTSESKIESNCACKLAPNPNQGLRPQIHCSPVVFNFSDSLATPVASLASVLHRGHGAIRAPPVSA